MPQHDLTHLNSEFLQLDLPGHSAQAQIAKRRKEEGYFQRREDKAGGGNPYVVLPFNGARLRVSLGTCDERLLEAREQLANSLYQGGASVEHIRACIQAQNRHLCSPPPVSGAGKPCIENLAQRIPQIPRPAYATTMSKSRINQAIAGLFQMGHYKSVAGDSRMFRNARQIDRELSRKVTLDRFEPADAIGFVSWAGDSAPGRTGLRRHESARHALLAVRAAMPADFIVASGLDIPRSFVGFIHDIDVSPVSKPTIWLARPFVGCWEPLLAVCGREIGVPDSAALLAPLLIASLPLSDFAEAEPNWFDPTEEALLRPDYGPLRLPPDQLRTLERAVFSPAAKHLLDSRSAMRDAEERLMRQLRAAIETIEAPEISRRPLAAIGGFGKKALLSTERYIDVELAKALTHSSARRLSATFGSDPLSAAAMDCRALVISQLTSKYGK